MSNDISITQAFDAIELLIAYHRATIQGANPVLANQNVTLLHAMHSALFETKHPRSPSKTTEADKTA